ncbi:MAG: replication-associated recombination protein A [Bacteroidia bacterium]
MSINIPLAERMRPHSLDEYLGQKHLIGPDGVLSKFVESGNLPSLILWGPPGVGKTTLAQLLAKHLQKEFYSLSAISSGVKDIREIIERTGKAGLFANTPIVFIDEIHRFSKSQQDALLGAVEKGKIILIGATTENPSFEVISALLSRCQVYVLKTLDKEDLLEMLNRAMKQDELLRLRKIELKETQALLRLSGGDGRKLLNLFEAAVMSISSGDCVITDEVVMNVAQQVVPIYDKKGEYHYDIISAFIKSMRGSDPNAAVYWLARMLNGGEDILFIARRMVILASEDIGNANPTALVIANNCFQAINTIGMPEARIILSQTAIYMSCSPKSNASYMAIEQAMASAAETAHLPVPLHLRNAPTKLMKDLDYGKDYMYAHSYEGNFVSQNYLPEDMKGTMFYEPGQNAKEEEFRKYLKKIWEEFYKY